MAPGLVRFLSGAQTRRVLASLVAVLAVLGAAPSVTAHGGRGLVVDPSIATPGSAISVHGAYLWTDQPVTIVLLAIDGTMWTLGDAVTSGNGDLEARVSLPADLPDATYSILARAANGEDAHVELLVRGDGTQAASVIGLAGALAAVAAVIAFTAAVVLRRRRRLDPGI